MIHDPPVLQIRRKFARPEPADLTRLAGVETGWLADAMNGRGALDYRIKPLDPERAAFVGVALTCACGPSDNLAVIAACALGQPGDVIMAATDNFTATAIVGDNVAGMARNKGLSAIVTDGMVRDSIGIVQTQLPVFAAGVTPNSCVRNGPGVIGQRIVIGGVPVELGDAVVADRDGVVVVPRADLPGILVKLAAIQAAEKELQGQVAGGGSSMAFMDELLKSDRVRYLD